MREKRSQQRCAKNVGLYCALLNGNVNRPVILRNFSGSGLFFETAVQIMPGTYVVLRTADAKDAQDSTMGSFAPSYSLDDSDPIVCSLFRSHMVAKVQRCERLTCHDEAPSYGVAAEIQMLTD